jgi:enamine deaminase RidA (YjgF/YER057c/UK114 family)
MLTHQKLLLPSTSHNQDKSADSPVDHDSSTSTASKSTDTTLHQARDVITHLLDSVSAKGLASENIVHAIFQFRDMASDFLVTNTEVINELLPHGLARASVQVDNLPAGVNFAMGDVVVVDASKVSRAMSKVLAQPLPIYNHVVFAEPFVATSAIQGFIHQSSFELPENLSDEVAQALVNLLKLLDEFGVNICSPSSNNCLEVVFISSVTLQVIQGAVALALLALPFQHVLKAVRDGSLTLIFEPVAVLPRKCRAAVMFTAGWERK